MGLPVIIADIALADLEQIVSSSRYAILIARRHSGTC
jgi:hypothetical protein